MKKFLFFIGMFVLNLNLQASEIVALVNDLAISSYDVSMRLKMLEMQQPGFSSSADMKTLRKKILEQLIAEKVKRIEGEKQGFKVSDEDVQNAIKHMEGRLGLSNSELRSLLAQHGVPYQALEEQVISDLYWLQVMKASDLPLDPVSDAEVKKRLEFLKAELNVPGYLVSEIIVGNEEKANEVKKLLDEGKEFIEIAHKYSTVPSAAQGGMLGWVKQGYYPKEIENILEKLEIGKYSSVIKSGQGYVILFLHDIKPATQDYIEVWEIAQMGIPNGTISPVLETMLKTLHECKSFIELAQNIAIEPSVQQGQLNPGQLPKELRDIIAKANENEVIGPVPLSGVQMFFMACSKQKKSLMPEKEVVREQLALEKTEKLSDKLLKSFLEKAIVEYK